MEDANPFLSTSSSQSAPTEDTNPFLKSPKNVKTAESLSGSQDFNKFCQRFVEAVTDGKTGQYPSAAAAWNDHVAKGKAKAGLTGITPGSLIYFNPDSSNGNFGHVGIYEGGGDFISATDNGVQSKSLKDWQQTTGQSILGYVPVTH